MSEKVPQFMPKYMIGTEEQQKWIQKYFFCPRGLSFFEPGAVPMDNPVMSAFNIAKASYQIRPEVFNMDYLSKSLNLKKEEIIKRMKRLYDERLIMYVMTPPMQLIGYGLYYWVVKLKEGTSKEKKQALSEWFQNKDEICTGAEAEGDFDYFNGCHMRVLDNLIYDIFYRLRDLPEVEYVHTVPIRRAIRDLYTNMPDSLNDYRKFFLDDDTIKRLAKMQDKMDLTDLRIFKALNTKRPMEEVYDFKVLHEISGLNPDEMLMGIKAVIENNRMLVPAFHFNTRKMGLKNRLFLIKLFQMTPSYRKAEIADEIATIPEFNVINEFTDSFYDIGAAAYADLTDTDALFEKINSFSEVEDVKVVDFTREFRRFTCRLDAENGMWEECVLTDDFLSDITRKAMPAINLNINKEEEK